MPTALWSYHSLVVLSDAGSCLTFMTIVFISWKSLDFDPWMCEPRSSKMPQFQKQSAESICEWAAIQQNWRRPIEIIAGANSLVSMETLCGQVHASWLCSSWAHKYSGTGSVLSLDDPWVVMKGFPPGQGIGSWAQGLQNPSSLTGGVQLLYRQGKRNLNCPVTLQGICAHWLCNLQCVLLTGAVLTHTWTRDIFIHKSFASLTIAF